MLADDQHTISDSGNVLRNKLGVTTQVAVDKAMNLTSRPATLAAKCTPAILTPDTWGAWPTSEKLTGDR